MRIVGENTQIRSRKLCWLIATLWFGGVGVGLATLDRAALVPGASGAVAADWPGKQILPFESNRANLVIFAHPLCPCTRATLHELQTLLTRTHAAINVRVCFFEPSHPSADWQRGPLWDLAASISGVKVQTDPDGRLADAFGAKTSGWATLYDPSGRLRFAGGITAARGHEGDNAGVDAIALILQGNSPAVARTPVFGCALPDVSLASAAEGSTR